MTQLIVLPDTRKVRASSLMPNISAPMLPMITQQQQQRQRYHRADSRPPPPGEENLCEIYVNKNKSDMLLAYSKVIEQRCNSLTRNFSYHLNSFDSSRPPTISANGGGSTIAAAAAFLTRPQSVSSLQHQQKQSPVANNGGTDDVFQEQLRRYGRGELIDFVKKQRSIKLLFSIETSPRSLNSTHAWDNS